MDRPKLDKNITLEDFKNYYWLKEELVNFCRELGINKTGGKLDIVYRIEKYLVTGETITMPEKKKTNSKFDWNTANLDLNTLITDNFKCTENVRNFFKKAIGDYFKFNVPFMKWTKANTEMTLRDAMEKWKEIERLQKDRNHKTEIAPQFEYNTYIRDFMEDNPKRSIKDAINCWNMKRNLPGARKYGKEDVTLTLTMKKSRPRN